MLGLGVRGRVRHLRTVTWDSRFRVWGCFSVSISGFGVLALPFQGSTKRANLHSGDECQSGKKKSGQCPVQCPV